MACQKDEPAILEVGGLNFGGKFRREELATERCKRPNFERFGDNGL